MKLNLKYYNGEDRYSDGDIENKIIDYINNTPNNDFEKVFEKDMRWPVYYHLSNIRKNILSWYSFDKDSSILEIGAGMGAITEILTKKAKRVVSVELSKRRATAIQNRCKNSNNLEIIVGNFNDIEFEEKFDYITLIGVLEYAPSFTDGKNPMHDFLNNIKKLLKPNGKILIAIENRMGLKYLCGANEDYTGIPYSGINNYYGVTNVKTLDKQEMISLLNSLNLKYNFYYPFPDYKFPEIIITDSFKKNAYDTKYMPYYSDYGYLTMNEINLFNQFNQLGLVSYFANSFLIEASNVLLKNEIELVKFQNVYRKKKYQLGTIVKENKVIKYSLCDDANSFMQKIYENHINLQKQNCNGVLKENSIIFEKLKMEKLIDIIFTDIDSFNKYFSKLIDCIKTSSKIEYYEENIFTKFNLKVEVKELEKMTFLKKGYLDMTYFNAFVDSNDNLIFIDQEWVFDYVPIEYIIYRNIALMPINYEEIIDANELYKKYNINRKLFEKLEKKFIEEIYFKNKNKYFENYKLIDVRANEINYKNLLDEHHKILEINNKLGSECNKLNTMYKSLELERNEILETRITLDLEKEELLKKHVELEASNELLKQEHEDSIEQWNKKLGELQNKYRETYEELQNKEIVLNGIYNSKTWKTIDKIKGLLKKIGIRRK